MNRLRIKERTATTRRQMTKFGHPPKLFFLTADLKTNIFNDGAIGGGCAPAKVICVLWTPVVFTRLG